MMYVNMFEIRIRVLLAKLSCSVQPQRDVRRSCSVANAGML